MKSGTVNPLMEGLQNQMVEKMREDKELYTIFYDDILCCVIGKKLWRKRLSIATETAAKVATPLDEAIALLLLENSWDVWREQFERKYSGTVFSPSEIAVLNPPGKEADARTKEARVASKFVPLYSSKSAEEGRPIHDGWSAEGLNRFTQLYNMVTTNRGRFKEFDEEYLENYKQRNAKGKRVKKKAMVLTFDDHIPSEFSDREDNFLDLDRRSKKNKKRCAKSRRLKEKN